jgi:hypothetical protein
MTTGQRHPIQARLIFPFLRMFRGAVSPPNAGRAPGRVAILIITVLVMLWWSADAGCAMNLRGGGFGGFHAAAGFRTFRAPPAVDGFAGRSGRFQPAVSPRIGAHVGPRAGSRVVRKPPSDGETGPRRPPRHRHPPIVVRYPPDPISPPVGVVPSGPVGPTGAPPFVGPGRRGPQQGPGGARGPAVVIPADDERRYVPDEVLVSFAANVPPRAIVTLAQEHRLALLGVHRLPLISTSLYRFRITDRRAVPAVLGRLQRDGRVGSAQPNYLYTLQADTEKSAAGDPAQYMVGKLHVAQAHAIATGRQVLVALIDSAVDTGHPDLAGLFAGQFDAGRGAQEPHEHGTAMASAIAAHGRLLGVAPAARLLPVRAFEGATASAQGTTTRILDGLQWVSDSAARVVNMSFTGPADPKLHEMIAALRQKGVVSIAAAGNNGPQAAPAFPAAYPEVIAVTATDLDDRLLPVANHGNYVAVAAPGVDILVAAPHASYTFTTGTSVAAAHVSGIAALLIEHDPGLTPDALQAILMRSAKDLGPKGRDDEYGAGLVDAYAALAASLPATADRAAQP